MNVKAKNIDVSNVEKFLKCGHYNGYEHCRCANIDSQIKLQIINGNLNYLCTKCLLSNQALALQSTLSTKDITNDETNNQAEDTIKVVETREIIPNKTFECDECNIVVVHKKQLETHKRLKHEDVINFTCNQCLYNCSSNNILEEHMSNHHQLAEEIECEKCSESFNSKKEKEEHERNAHLSETLHISVNQTLQFQCDKCSFEANQENNLSDHEKQVHNNQHTDTQVAESHKCNLCQIILKSKYDLKEHIESSHTVSSPLCGGKCQDYESLEKDRVLLKQNYKRLININK